MNAQELKDLLTMEQIEYILSTLGAEPRVDSYNNIIHSLTICHQGDSHKLVYYHKDQRFKCYTGCGKTFDIIGLVEHVLDISFTMAMNYICDKVGISRGTTKQDELFEYVEAPDYLKSKVINYDEYKKDDYEISL